MYACACVRACVSVCGVPFVYGVWRVLRDVRSVLRVVCGK